MQARDSQVEIKKTAEGDRGKDAIMRRRIRENASLPARFVLVLAVSVSLTLVVAACGASKPAATAQPTTPVPAAGATTAPPPASPTDTPFPSVPTAMEEEQLLIIEPEMVLIPTGEFTMGSDPGLDPEAVDDEGPQHRLYLPDYYLAKTPVTNAQYGAFVQATGHPAPYHWGGGFPPRRKEDHPVVNVSWHDALAYCNWLAEVTGKPYRLPSEAEWEKAARGDDGRIYPWGAQWDPARCNSREGGQGDTIAEVGIYIGDTTPVDAYPEGASPYGLLDMAGNVWEWTSSVYEVYPYDPVDGREDLQAGDDVRRVLRGGAFVNLGWRVRSAFRGHDLPDFFFWDRGFRVALDPD
jgi:formylglycine-generating enzyme required for sulfatase activity